MTVRPEIEEAVAAKNAAFTARGGRAGVGLPRQPVLARPHAPEEWRHEYVRARTQPEVLVADGWRRPAYSRRLRGDSRTGRLGSRRKRARLCTHPRRLTPFTK